MTTRPIDVPALAAAWRAALEVQAPWLKGMRLDERAAAVSGQILAQLAPEVWRPAGEALLLALQVDMHSGCYPAHSAVVGYVQARAALNVLDAALARATEPSKDTS
ncbi:hypothetical protein [Cellulomonas sp. HZM]|uniref:hypothetical protein n=1 Tax=Cellulomonas sp. HZM TaxID=1454010 RepID=UPI000492FE38|nr:hypothetical protein [Cellulomonas sp. HZM]